VRAVVVGVPACNIFAIYLRELELPRHPAGDRRLIPSTHLLTRTQENR
jgi:hypothetical protein